MSEAPEDIDPIAFTEKLYGEVPEIMQFLWAIGPWGQEVKLSNGRVGRFKRFVEPRERDGRWEYGFDVIFEDGASPDHLEFFMIHTGGGGMVMAPNAPPISAVGRA